MSLAEQRSDLGLVLRRCCQRRCHRLLESCLGLQVKYGLVECSENSHVNLLDRNLRLALRLVVGLGCLRHCHPLKHYLLGRRTMLDHSLPLSVVLLI